MFLTSEMILPSATALIDTDFNVSKLSLTVLGFLQRCLHRRKCFKPSQAPPPPHTLFQRSVIHPADLRSRGVVGIFFGCEGVVCAGCSVEKGLCGVFFFGEAVSLSKLAPLGTLRVVG